MVYVVAKIFPKKEMRAEFDILAKELIELTRKEDGCIQYVLTTSYEKKKDDEEMLCFVETWASKEHLDAHGNSEHFKRLIPQIGAMCLKESEVEVLEDCFK